MQKIAGFMRPPIATWTNMFLKNPWLLSEYNRDINLPQIHPLEVIESDLSQAIQIMANQQEEGIAPGLTIKDKSKRQKL
uniref:Uncharacterized protein n=1 Tax=Romanomermis culicivorax TaxID=13658 RepID=A0A915KXT5_ROMCU